MTLLMSKAIEQAQSRSSLLVEATKAGYGALGRVISSLAGTGGLDPISRNVNNLALHAEQLRHFQGFPYAIIRTIANRIAGQPLRIARKVTPEERPSKRISLRNFDLKHRHLVPKEMQASAMENLEHLDHHPLLKTFARPNPFMIRSALMFQTIASLELTGKAYWWVLDDYGSDGADPSPDLVPGPLTIWPLPASWVEPHHEAGELYKEWWLQPAGTGEKYAVPTNQIVYFYYPDPANPLGACSPLQALAKSVVADESVEEAQRRSFINGLNPGLAVIVGQWPEMQAAGVQSQAVLTRDQRNVLITMLKQQYRGVVNFDEPLILDGLIKDVKKITMAPQEMDFLNSSKATKERLSLGWGTNAIVMGQVEGANRASSATADDHFVANVINPRLGMLSEVMTIYLAPRLAEDGDELVLYLEAAHSVDIDYDLSVETAMVDRAAMSRNEWRQRHHLPPLADGDSVIVGGTEIPVERAPDDGVKRRKRKPRRLVPLTPSTPKPARPGDRKAGESQKIADDSRDAGIDEAAVAEAAEQLAENPEKSPDYGQTYVHQVNRAVWYTLADGDGREIQGIAERLFGGIPGVEIVQFGDEAPPPEDDGWRQVWPKIRDHVSRRSGEGSPILKCGMSGDLPSTLLDVPDVRQPDSYSCGACAAMSVGHYFGVGPAGLEEWKEALGTTADQATSPGSLIACLTDLGLAVTPATGMSIAELRECWQAGFPVICPVQAYGPATKQDVGPGGIAGHYVVVIGAALGYIFVQDSSLANGAGDDSESNQAPGRSLIAEDKWLDIWHDEDADGEVYYRYGIIVGPPEARNADSLAGRAWEKIAGRLERKASGKFSSTMVDIDGEALEAITALGESIQAEDLAHDGTEGRPHITVKYGLHTDDPEDVRRLVADFGPVIAELGKLSLFENEEHDVLIIEVISEDLHALNSLLAESLEHTDTHPDYQPHVTIAYLKPGEGQHYLSALGDEAGAALEGTPLSFSELIFSDSARNETVISLTDGGTLDADFLGEAEGKCGGEGGTPGPCPTGTEGGSSTSKPVHKPAGETMEAHLGKLDPDKPLSEKHEQKIESKSNSRVRRIFGAIASLPGKAVPQVVKDTVSRVKGAIVKKMNERYGERATNVIMKVAAISAPIPVPGSQPIAIATSLLIAEGVRLVNKLRAKPAAAPSGAGATFANIWRRGSVDPDGILTAGQIAAASDLLMSDCQRQMEDALEQADDQESGAEEEEKAGFFADCDRDDAGHCKPGSGGSSDGGNAGDTDAGSSEGSAQGQQPKTEEEYQAALEQYESDHAEWEEGKAAADKEHQEAVSEYEKEKQSVQEERNQAQQKFEAAHGEWQEQASAAQGKFNEAHQGWQEQCDKLTEAHEAAHGEWQSRQDARDAIREHLDGMMADRAGETADWEAPAVDGETLENIRDVAKEYPARVRQEFMSAFGADGKLGQELAEIGASEAERAKVQGLAERGLEAVGKAADKHAELVSAYGDFRENELDPHEAAEPIEPEPPADLMEGATPEEEAKYNEAVTKYEADVESYREAQEAWEKAGEKLQKRNDSMVEKINAQEEKVKEVAQTYQEKIGEAVNKIDEKLTSRLDKEDEKDAEPEEPELPDEPDLDEFMADVPDEPDLDEFMADAPELPEPPEHPGYDPEPVPPVKPGAGDGKDNSGGRRKAGKAGRHGANSGKRRSGQQNGQRGGQRSSVRLLPCLLDRLDERGYLRVWCKQVDRFTIPFARSMTRYFRSLRSGALSALEEALSGQTAHLSPALVEQALHSSEWEAGLLQAAAPHIEDAVASGALLEWQLHKPDFHRGLRLPLIKDAGRKAGDRLRVDMATLPESVRHQVRALVAELLGADSWKDVVPKIRLDLYEVINDLAKGSGKTKPLKGRKLAAAAVKKVLGVNASSRRADRIARTETTSATNGGQQVTRERLTKLGVVRAKQWIATLDSVTRDDHEHAHGQTVAPDENFELGAYECAYPGDPALPAAQRCNCRCVVRSVRSKEDQGKVRTAGRREAAKI